MFFFFWGWLRFGIDILFSVLLVLTSYAFLKHIGKICNSEKTFYFHREHFLAFIVLFLFLLSTGNTGFIGSWGSDIPWRNAIYQDLIHQTWPVIYDYSQSMLCYYMIFWLVPAEISSILGLNEFGSNVVLFLWMYVGIVLIFLILCDILEVRREYILLMTIIFLFFSGINTVGMILKSFLLEPTPLISNYPGGDSWAFSALNINGQDYFYSMRTIYLCIADVYNQFFGLAISTLLFFRFKYEVDYYVFICILALPYSPIGFIGLVGMVGLYFCINVLNNRSMLNIYLRKAFSRINVLCSISFIPLFYLYFTMNFYAKAINNGGNHSLFVSANQYNADSIALLMLYYYLYFLIYALLIYNNYKCNSLYWVVLFCLIVFPFFKIGSGIDFNLNSTIAPYLILNLLIIKHLLSSLNNKNFKIKDLALVFCLSIAMLTPLIQIMTSFRAAYLNNSISYRWTPWDSNLMKDSFKDKKIEGFRNFLAQDYNRHFFYIYLSRRNK
jgi:hypothetical protein